MPYANRVPTFSGPRRFKMKQKEQKFVDPVCRMEVDPKKTPYKTEYKGKTYYF